MTTVNKTARKNFKKLMRGSRLFDFGKQLIQKPRNTPATTMKQMRMHINDEKVITDGVDIELPALKRRELLPSGSHQAPYPGFGETEPLQTQKSGFENDQDLGVAFQKTMMEGKVRKVGTIMPIDGNIYRYWAFGGFFGGPVQSNGMETFFRKTIGMLACATIQLTAPLAVVVSTCFSIDWGPVEWHSGSTWYDPGSDEHGVSYLLARILGLIFIVAYTLWALEKLDGEKDDWRKLFSLLKIYEQKQEDCSEEPEGICGMSSTRFFLYLGPAINCFTYLLCGIAMGLVLKIAESPKDVVFDSLSLLFLIKLDDMDSDLGLLSEDDWNRDMVGEFVYNNIQCTESGFLATDSEFFLDPCQFPEGDPRRNLTRAEIKTSEIYGDTINIDFPETLVDNLPEGHPGVITDHPCYKFTYYILILLITFGVFFWFFVNGLEVKKTIESATEQALDDLTATVTKLAAELVTETATVTKLAAELVKTQADLAALSTKS